MSRPLVAVVDGDYHMLRGEGTTAAVLIDLLGRTCGGVDEGFVAVFVKAEPSRLLNYGRRGGRRLIVGRAGDFLLSVMVRLRCDTTIFLL